MPCSLILYCFSNDCLRKPASQAATCNLLCNLSVLPILQDPAVYHGSCFCWSSPEDSRWLCAATRDPSCGHHSIRRGPTQTLGGLGDTWGTLWYSRNTQTQTKAYWHALRTNIMSDIMALRRNCLSDNKFLQKCQSLCCISVSVYIFHKYACKI